MKIGEIVKMNIRKIFKYCNEIDHDELNKLLDINYSKETFGINYPFCIETTAINKDDNKKQSKRFWTEIFLVRGKRVRVTSQWFESSIPLFLKYLDQKNIEFYPGNEILLKEAKLSKITVRSNNRSNSRWKGNAIGNAQNLFIRNILSNLGKESFSESDWEQTKEYFSNKCAYCGTNSELQIEHAIPINKEKLGEHKLGNIIPSCRKCNSRKSGKDYIEFLDDNISAIEKIESYMEYRNYVPLENNEQLKKILKMAYHEVSVVADRYITIINELFIQE